MKCCDHRTAFAPSSLRNLHSQWRAFILFSIYFHLGSLPASLDTICLVAQFLNRTCKSVTSIRNQLNGVKVLHLLSDLYIFSFQ